MTLTVNILVIVATGLAIFLASFRFTEASTRIGDYIRMPRSVKGATFDAISSSFPELMIALIALLRFNKFDVGIGTIAGSALFNLLLISGVSVLLAPKAFKVTQDVVHRDGMFYLMSVFALLVAIMFFSIWTILMPLAFLAIYMWYIKSLHLDGLGHDKKALRKDVENISIGKEIMFALITMTIIGIAAYFLTEHSILLAENLGVPAVMIGFTVIAVTTSFPDAIISFINARKGNLSDSMSNVFGSNIFDILVGLSIPALIATLVWGPIQIVFDQLGIIVFLLGSTILVQYFFSNKHTLRKSHAIVLILTYIGFFAYVVYLSIH